MRKTMTIAFAATLLGLGGCATTKDDPVHLTNGDAGTVTAAPAIATPAPTAPTAEVNGQFIDAAAVLDKLEEIGCKLSEVQIREVKRGGHFGAKCVIDDPLNAKVEDL
jgi:hypothetical protein